MTALNLELFMIDNRWFLLLFGLLTLATLCLALLVWRKRNRHFSLPEDSLKNESELPTDKYIEVDDFKIRYWQQGQGRDLLLIHGIGASLYIWRFIFNELSKHYKVTALDLPGFGRSSKPMASYGLDEQTERVQKFMTQLNIKKTAVVGSSMGGTIALWLAKSYPKSVSSVVAMAPAAHKKLVILPIPILKAFRSPSMSLFKTKTLQKRILKTVLHDHSLITHENMQIYFEPYRSNPAAFYSFVDSLRLIKDPRLPDELKNVKAPVLLYYGQHDKIVPVKNMIMLQKILPKAQVFIDESSAHHPMEDHPEAVFKQASLFLKSN